MSSRRKHSRNKSYENFKNMETSKKNTKHRGDEKIESKTPPLPNKKSIQELYRKREFLKKELKKMERYSSDSLDTNQNETMRSEKKETCAESESTSSTNTRKRLTSDNKYSGTSKAKPKDISADCIGDIAELDTDDEDSLIQKSRQRRHLLLEKFNVFNEVRHVDIKNDFKTTIKPKTEKSSIDSTTYKQTTDMFAIEDYAPKKEPESVVQDDLQKNPELADNWDDSEGYYNARIGYKLNDERYTIKDILGKGVFANVVRAQDSYQGNAEVAIKIIRNNDIMFKTGMKEINILKSIKEADPDNKYHCVRILRYFLYKNHLCIVLESLYTDLRSFVKKYVKNGLGMKLLILYSRQLLTALRILKKIGIIHADIKPDNILINAKKNCLKLCDFGSACKADETEPTPYMVSRFYRAPEIILGIPYRHSVDVWSTACTMYEMATGKILFAGNSNNKMLKCFMDLKGKFPNKLIKKGKFKNEHFNGSNNFLLHKKDECSGRESVSEVIVIDSSRDLQKELNKYYKGLPLNEDKKLHQFRDILDKMLTLDLNQRITVSDCLKHPFIQEVFK